jgi:hypothetical protein
VFDVDLIDRNIHTSICQLLPIYPIIAVVVALYAYYYPETFVHLKSITMKIVTCFTNYTLHLLLGNVIENFFYNMLMIHYYKRIQVSLFKISYL